MLIALFAVAAMCGLAAAVLFAEDVQAPTTPISVVTTAETLIATSANITVPNPNGKSVVRAWCDLQVGASTTAVTIAIYQGIAITGTLVGSKIAQAGNFAAGSIAHFEIEFISTFANVGAVQFCMSVQQTGASGNGSVVAAIIDTKVLSG